MAPHLLPAPGNTDSGEAGPGEADGTGWMRERLAGPGRIVERTRLRPDGRIEGVFDFDSVDALCAAPLLRRDCRYRQTAGGGFEFSMELPAAADFAPRAAAGSAPAAAEIRVRAEGRIISHNGDGPIERGNVVVWRRPAEGRAAADGAPGDTLRVRTDGASVFAYTARTVGRSALIALAVVAASLALLVFEGRRRLRRTPRAAAEGGPGGDD